MTDTAPWSSTPLDTCQDGLTSASHADVAVAIDQLLSRLTRMDTSQRLHHLRQLQCLVNDHMDEAAREARSAGATWQEIGQSLGITRQAAQSRWGEREDRKDATPVTSQSGTSKGRTPPVSPHEVQERLSVSLPGIPGSLALNVSRKRIPPART
jgi:hypothetical protein